MLANRLWISPLMVLCFAQVGIAEANASKKKAKVKTEVVTLKLSNLTSETTKKDVKKLQTTLKKVKGVTKVAVLKKKGEVTVRHTKVATVVAIKTAVGKAGFTVVEPKAEGEPDEDPYGDEGFDDEEG